MNLSPRFRLLCCALVSLSTIVLQAAGPEYDLIIRHGKIVDGSGNPWFYGDVAVKGDRIAAIGRVGGDAKRMIDATGLVVSRRKSSANRALPGLSRANSSRGLFR